MLNPETANEALRVLAAIATIQASSNSEPERMGEALDQAIEDASTFFRINNLPIAAFTGAPQASESTNTQRAPRFQIGTTFTTGGKHPRLYTVTDILRIYDNSGALVQIRYVATHQFLGQTVTDHNVCETTIARGLVA